MHLSYHWLIRRIIISASFGLLSGYIGIELGLPDLLYYAQLIITIPLALYVCDWVDKQMESMKAEDKG